MSKNRDFKGIWIPAKIWLSDELTLQEKVFLVEIDSLDNEDGCWANNQYFADFFKISKTRVSLIIKSLVDKGYVFTQVDASKGNKRILSTSQTKVKEVIKESLRGSLRKVKEGRKGKLTHNNTSNNTSNNTREEKENPPDFVLENRKKAKEHAENKTLYFKNEPEPNKAMESYMIANIIPLAKNGMYFKRFTNYNAVNPKRRKELVEAFCLDNCMKLDGWGDSKKDSNTDLLFHFANWLKYRIAENENQTYKIPTT